MMSKKYTLAIGIVLIFTSALAGCIQQTEPLPLTEDEIGEWSVVVTIDFGMGAFIHTVDGVAGAADYSTWWGFTENGEMASVGASSLMISSNTTLGWILTDGS